MILVTGATGSIGGHLVRGLRAEGVPFRALVRDARKGEALGCDFVVGDFDDPPSVEAALTGVDRLFLNAGGALPAVGEQPMIRQQKTAIDAARAAGVAHIVKVSVWGAEEGGRLAEGAHWHIEQHLKRSGVDWSLLRPSGFMQNFVTGAAALTDDGSIVAVDHDSPVSYVDCQDIAACAAVLLTTDRGRNETFVLTGPEPLTHARVAGKLSAARGRPVGFTVRTSADLTADLTARGLPAPFVEDIVTLWAKVAAGSLSTTTTTVQDLTGHPARTFDAFLAENRARL